MTYCVVPSIGKGREKSKEKGDNLFELAEFQCLRKAFYINYQLKTWHSAMTGKIARYGTITKRFTINTAFHKPCNVRKKV